MAKDVGIVGFAQTEHREKISNMTSAEMVYQVTKEALNSCSLFIKDIDTVIESSSDYWDGAGCSNVTTMEGAGAYLKEESKVEEDGALALIYAFLRLNSGLFDTALVVSHTRCSDSPPIASLSNLMGDPFYQRQVGLDDHAAAALQMNAYMKDYKVQEEDIAQVSVKNLNNALNNPHSHRKMKIGVEKVLKSKVTAYPLRELTSPPASDGACAVVLAAGNKAKQISDSPVWITGIGHSTEDYFLSDRNLTESMSLKSAMKKAYRMARVEAPLKQIDVAEVCEPYAFQEILWYEHLGFCGKGKGARLLREGVTSMQGDLPVNPSGGVISTNPYIARGLIRVAEVSAQIMGKGGRRQIEGAKTGLCHAMSGLGGQLHCVMILSSEPKVI